MTRFAPLVCVLACLLAATAACHPATTPAPRECLLGRDNPSGVVGMDGASSIPLDGGRTLFVFGDTFTGTLTDERRQITGGQDSSAMVVRHADLDRCFAGTPFVGGGSPARVLRRPAGAADRDRFWPGWGRSDGSRLWLFYTHALAGTTEPLGFSVVGHGVATGSADALQLQAAIPELPGSEPILGSALLLHGGHAFIYRCAPGKQLGTGLYPCKLGRAPQAQANDPSAYRYHVAGRGFVGALAGGSLVVEGAPDFSVTYNPALGRFLMIYIEPFSRHVTARTALAPEGPWSTKQQVWPCTLPALQDAFCYAAKQHLSLGDPGAGRVVISYNTNGSLTSLATHPSLYWPRLLRLEVSAITVR